MPDGPATPYCTVQDVIDGCAWPAFGTFPATAQALMIAAASKSVDKYCRRPFGFSERSVTESFGGANRQSLWLSLRPVQSVMAVVINGTPLDNTFGTAWAFHPDTGKLVRGSGMDDTRFIPWYPAGDSDVSVQYWGGYNPLPEVIVLATAWYVRWVYERGRQPGLYKSEQIGDYQYELRENFLHMGLPDHVAALLNPYVQDDAF